jgi:hypothetical protein
MGARNARAEPRPWVPRCPACRSAHRSQCTLMRRQLPQLAHNAAVGERVIPHDWRQ